VISPGRSSADWASFPTSVLLAGSHHVLIRHRPLLPRQITPRDPGPVPVHDALDHPAVVTAGVSTPGGSRGVEARLDTAASP
jgi:hypothetical protein